MANASRMENGKRSKAPPPEPAKPRPVHEIRLGRIKAAVWANDTEHGVRHNVTFSCIYFVDGQWKQSDSFGRDDLPLLQKVADLAHTWVFTEAQHFRTDNQGGDEEIPY